MVPTHRHSGNGLPYHWDGQMWWYLSPSRGKWIQAEFIVENKMVKL